MRESWPAKLVARRSGSQVNFTVQRRGPSFFPDAAPNAIAVRYVWKLLYNYHDNPQRRPACYRRQRKGNSPVVPELYVSS